MMMMKYQFHWWRKLESLATFHWPYPQRKVQRPLIELAGCFLDCFMSPVFSLTNDKSFVSVLSFCESFV